MGRTGKRAYHLGAAHSALWGNASSDTTGNSETFLSRWRFQSAPTMPAHTMVMAPTGKAYWMKNVAASGAPSIMPSTSTANGLPGPMTTLQPTKNASMMLMGLMPAATSVGNKTPRHTTNVPMALGRMSMSTNEMCIRDSFKSKASHAQTPLRDGVLFVPFHFDELAVLDMQLQPAPGRVAARRRPRAGTYPVIVLGAGLPFSRYLFDHKACLLYTSRP